MIRLRPPAAPDAPSSPVYVPRTSTQKDDDDDDDIDFDGEDYGEDHDGENDDDNHGWVFIYKSLSLFYLFPSVTV